MKSLIILMIRAYQRLYSSRTSRRCVFNPTCSQFTIQAISEVGVKTGLRISIARLRRCDGGIFRGEDYPKLASEEDVHAGV